MTDIKEIVDNLCNFIAYVDSFYNEETGIYPIKGMTNRMVTEAVKKYINKAPAEFCADSVDRENIRDIILKDNNLKWTYSSHIDNGLNF